MLILTRGEAIPLLNQVLAVPATSTIRGIPTEVELDASDGMQRSCALSLDNLQPIIPELCTERITTLGADRLSDVCAALRVAVAC